MLFPLVGVYWGVLLLRDTAREERVRMFIGFTVLCAGVLGLLSLLGSDPAPTAGYALVAAAGGVMGALVAHPLANVISPIGAAIVCLGLTLLGLLIFTGTPIATAWSHLHDFFTAADVEEDDDPAPAQLVVEEPAGPKVKKERVRHLKEAFGLLEPEGDELVVVPESDLESDLDEEWDTDDDDEPAAPAAVRRSRTVETADGPYQLPPLDLLREAPPVDGRRRRPGADARGARADAPQLRGRCARHGRAPRPDGHDVRGRGRRRHEGQQGAVAVQRHRLRAGHARRADPGADPRQVRDRHRGARTSTATS